jgi:hypothetical protein
MLKLPKINESQRTSKNKFFIHSRKVENSPVDTILPKIQKKPVVDNLSSFKAQASSHKKPSRIENHLVDNLSSFKAQASSHKKPPRIENYANYKQFILGNMGKQDRYCGKLIRVSRKKYNRKF